MSVLSDHFPLLVLLAALLSAFLALLWKDDAASARRLFLRAFVGLTGGALALALLFAGVSK